MILNETFLMNITVEGIKLEGAVASQPTLVSISRSRTPYEKIICATVYRGRILKENMDA
jgi:hypothetical protein